MLTLYVLIWSNGKVFTSRDKAQVLRLALPGDVIYETVLSNGETV